MSQKRTRARAPEQRPAPVKMPEYLYPPRSSARSLSTHRWQEHELSGLPWQCRHELCRAEWWLGRLEPLTSCPQIIQSERTPANR